MRASPRLRALNTELGSIKAAIDKIEGTATKEGRDVTDAEQADVDKLLVRAAAIKPEIEAEGDRHDSLEASAEILKRIMPTEDDPKPRRTDAGTPPSIGIGEWFSLALRSRKGDKAAGELLLRATPEEMTTADNPGVLPQPIIGPVIKLADSRRPVFGSLTGRPMPASGKKFNRPRVTQRVLVGEQMAELDELATRKMTLTSDEVSKRTFAGILELSEQDIDWTDPAILQIVIEDFAQEYGEVTEIAACTALEALATAESAWDPTDVRSIVSSITGGIGDVYDTAKRMPDRVWLSLDEMLTLAGTTNSTGQVTAMTLIKQALADAGVPMTFVTGPSLSAGTRIIGCSSLVESYENQKGLLSAPDVGHLGVFIAYRGYVAFHGLAAGFVALTEDAS